MDTIGCHLIGQSFIGADSVGAVLQKGAELKRQGYRITYNLLGEHVKDEGRVSMAVDTTRTLIEAMDDATRGNVSIKPTLYGLAIGRLLWWQNAGDIIECGKQARIEIEFDAEQYECLNDTLIVFWDFASQFHYRGFVRQAVQAHLADAFRIMSKFDLWDKKLRIVKGGGIYREASTRLFLKDKPSIMAQYYAIARANHAHGQVPYLATMRDRALVANARRILPSPHMFEFQMLYGPLGRILGEELLKSGAQVRMYIPFVVPWCKDEWKSYGMRRSATVRRLFFEDPEVRQAILREIKKRLFSAAEK
jgi:hypothetical protein